MDKKNDLATALTNESNNLLTPLLIGTNWENTPWKLGRQINQQLSAVWAQHLLTGEFGDQQVAFFRSHATVPEPRTAWLILLPLLLLALQRRKINSNHIILEKSVGHTHMTQALDPPSYTKKSSSPIR